MNNSTGSYKFETLGKEEKNKELKRLERKANCFLDLEKEKWMSAGLKSGMKALDLGCGAGFTSCEIAKITYPGTVIGVDVSEAMLEKAKEVKKSKGIKKLSFQQSNVYKLNYTEKYFDFVYGRFLFQHLVEPITALINISKFIKPGGIICVLDVDDDWFTVNPQVESLTKFVQKMAAVRQGEGGDPYVGRKLWGYFQKAGLINIKTQVEVITSDRIGLKNYLDLLSFGTPYLSKYPDLASAANQAKKDAYSLLDLPDAWAAVGLFVATGRKPDEV